VSSLSSILQKLSQFTLVNSLAVEQLLLQCPEDNHPISDVAGDGSSIPTQGNSNARSDTDVEMELEEPPNSDGDDEDEDADGKGDGEEEYSEDEDEEEEDEDEDEDDELSEGGNLAVRFGSFYCCAH